MQNASMTRIDCGGAQGSGGEGSFVFDNGTYWPVKPFNDCR